MPNNAADTGMIFTLDGVRKLEDELDQLKSVRRQEIAERIKVAISFGDISENAEYDEAKNEQAFVEGRIMQLENMLRSAKVVSDEDVDVSQVGVGAVVKVFYEEEGEEEEYAIVGSAEADPIEGRISNESPLGRSLIGKHVGETAVAQIPDGAMTLKILEIRRQQ